MRNQDEIIIWSIITFWIFVHIRAIYLENEKNKTK